MTNYLYVLNKGQEYNLELKQTKNFEVIKEELLKAVKEFKDEAYGYDTMFYLNKDYNTEYSSEYILKQIQEALNNNMDIELYAVSDCSDYDLTIKIINKEISFEIIIFGTTNYFYRIETIDLNDKKLENELI